MNAVGSHCTGAWLVSPPNLKACVRWSLSVLILAVVGLPKMVLLYYEGNAVMRASRESLQRRPPAAMGAPMPTYIRQSATLLVPNARADLFWSKTLMRIYLEERLNKAFAILRDVRPLVVWHIILSIANEIVQEWRICVKGKIPATGHKVGTRQRHSFLIYIMSPANKDIGDDPDAPHVAFQTIARLPFHAGCCQGE
jgi:hypothetical protein